MLRSGSWLLAVAALAGAGGYGQASDRDFSGTWIRDNANLPPEVRPAPPERIAVTQTASAVECVADAEHWTYALDRSEQTATIGSQTWNSVAKWEGAALLIDSLVSGTENFALADRWELSRNQALLIVTRQVSRGMSHTEGQFYYRREKAAATVPLTPQQELARRPETPPDEDFVIKSGTHVLLELVNSLDTKHSKEGDRVYLRTSFPVYAGRRLVIAQGSTVLGTVTEVKPPGKTKGRGELFIRFDSLTLPNGVSRDFRSRLGSAGANGTVDSEDGKVTGPGNGAEEARATARGAGMGAAVGGIAGAAAGHPITGLGVGGAVGAAAGLATVMAKGKPGVVLPKGANVEMVLDRDLHYRLDELH